MLNTSDARLMSRAIINIAKNVDDLHRRQASTILSGTVHEVDGNRVRLKLQDEDSRTGKPFLSPWVQLQELAGGSSSNMPVKLGDPLRLLSPNGEIGTQSLAIRDSHTDDAQNPEQVKEFVFTHDGASIRMDGDGIVLSVGASSLTISPSLIRAASSLLQHNEKNIGDDHKHTGVVPGVGQSGVPT